MEIQKRMNNIIQELEQLITDIQNDNLQNEQFALDFIDKVNKLSISF